MRQEGGQQQQHGTPTRDLPLCVVNQLVEPWEPMLLYGVRPGRLATCATTRPPAQPSSAPVQIRSRDASTQTVYGARRAHGGETRPPKRKRASLKLLAVKGR